MNCMRTGRRWMAPALTCLLAAMGACGEDSTPTTPPVAVTTTTTTTQPPAPAIVQGTTALPARQVFFTDVTTTTAGRLTVTVDYASANNHVLLWLTDRKCSFNMFDRDDCDYLVKSLEGAKPRIMTSPSVGPGTYTLFVSNDGPGDEQLTYRVTLAP